MGGGCLDDATLLAFLNGTLPDRSRAPVEAHVASCSACCDLTTWAAAELASRESAPGNRRQQMIGELAVGSQVGRYQILGALGRGGMGEVFAAYHPDLERRIALKIVAESGADSAERRTRLLREARAIARLSHPNVVAVYDAGTVGNRVYIAMELVEGETVDAWLLAARRDWREVLEVFIEAGRGLAAAHAAEIIHRDFKPHNIMIGKDGKVRVMDFGLARLENERLPADARPDVPATPGDLRPATVTKTGALLGTPAYMAPEQFRGEPTDARADQFSYCVALHEALYGVRPRLAHLDLEPSTAPTLVSADVRQGAAPAWLRVAILRGLRHDPAQRFASMNQLLLVLEQGRARPRRRVLAAAAGLVLALAAAGGWRVSHPRRYDCKAPSDRLAATWPLQHRAVSRRDSLRQALLATGRNEATAVWGQLSTALDAHVGKWASMYQETCEATHLRGEQSAEVLDLRMRCLARNLDEVRALTDVLIRADPRTVGQAAAATAGLTPVATCADVAWLRSKVPLPRDEATRRRVEALQQALNDLHAMRDVGSIQPALEKARALQRPVEETRYPPLMAELLLQIGLIKVDLGDFAGSEAALKDSFVAAEAGNDDAVRAQAASILIFAVGIQGRREESDFWVRNGNAILDRLGPGHSRTRAWILNDQGGILALDGKFAAAVRAIEQSIALKEELLGPNHPDVAVSLSNLGWALKGTGKLDAALAAEDRALAIWGEQGTLLTAKAESNKGEILILLGRYEEAEQALQHALRVFEQEGDPDNVELAYPLTGLAQVKLATGDVTAARSLFERALRIREQKEKTPALVAETRFGLARALWETPGTRARALALARAARAGYADGRHADELVTLARWLATRRAGARSP